jgi:hypothetical protein
MNGGHEIQQVLLKRWKEVLWIYPLYILPSCEIKFIHIQAMQVSNEMNLQK